MRSIAGTGSLLAIQHSCSTKSADRYFHTLQLCQAQAPKDIGSVAGFWLAGDYGGAPHRFQILISYLFDIV
jgi:hypothetical protein